MTNPSIKIGVVGPCAAGKSTLVAKLQQLGVNCRHIAQEHSFVPNMWQRITKPDLLIYLDVSYPLTLSRRKMDWTEQEYQEQCYRLRHARQHAHLYIDTDELTPQQVLEIVVLFLQDQAQMPTPAPGPG